MKPSKRLTSLGLSFALGILGATPASANNIDQEGRATSATSVDGATIDITPSSFNPANQQCVIYSVVVSDDTTPRQMQTGVVRCLNKAMSLACTTGHTFTESFDGISYHCAVGSTFTNGATVTGMVQRTSGTTSMWGSIGGSYLSQSGFNAGDLIYSTAWGEATGDATTCPATPHSAHFANWKKFQNASGWSYVSASIRYSNPRGISGVPCWAASALLSGGTFDVY